MSVSGLVQKDVFYQTKCDRKDKRFFFAMEKNLFLCLIFAGIVVLERKIMRFSLPVLTKSAEQSVYDKSMQKQNAAER